MQWLRDNFLPLFAAALVVNLLGMAWILIRRIWREPLFPPRTSVTIGFEERWTSGRSFKTWLTRLGGANNCLRVTVTEDEIWVTPHVPFSLFADQLDLEHRIRIRDLTRIDPRKRSLELEFRTATGESRTLELCLRRSAEFLAMVRSKRTP